MELNENLKKLLSKTKLLLHPDDYFIVSIDANDESKARLILNSLNPFSSITFDKSEISLVIKSKEWNNLKKRFSRYKEEGPYSLITFDIVLDLSIVGFLSVISERLAENGISIFAISTYLKDHILVKSEDVSKALRILKHMIETCSNN